MPDLFTMSPRPGSYFHTMFGGDEIINGFHLSAQAAEQAYYLLGSSKTPWDYTPRRVTWQEREAAKFEQDLYTAPVWADEEWWQDPGHFAHISLDDPTKIAFTENDEKGARDIQLRMKPGKYLTKFFPHLQPKQVAFYAEWFAQGKRPPTPGLGQIQFARDPDDIVGVYERGPSSCMKNMDCVRIYGAGDLAVAYVEKDDKVISRAICWPEKKVFGRVYPTPEAYWASDGYASPEASQAVQDDLFHRLREMGWKSCAEGGSLDGARLLLIEENGGIVAPYIDNADYVHRHPTSNHLVWGLNRSGANYDCRCTCGYLDDHDPDYDEDAWVCECCDENMSGDSSSYDVFDGWSPTEEVPYGCESWCHYCSYNSDRTFYCEATNVRYDNRQATEREVIVRANGATETWVDDYFDVNGFTCDETGEHYTTDLRVEMADSSQWGLITFKEQGFSCSYDKMNYPNTEMSEKHPGWPASYDSSPFTMDFRRKHGTQ